MSEQSQPGRKVRTNALAVRNLILALMEGPHTYLELAEVSGLHDKTVRQFLIPFRKTPRLVRIGEWHEDVRGYSTRPAFVWGSGPDAKRTPLSSAERSRRSRERVKTLKLHKTLAGLTP